MPTQMQKFTTLGTAFIMGITLFACSHEEQAGTPGESIRSAELQLKRLKADIDELAAKAEQEGVAANKKWLDVEYRLQARWSAAKAKLDALEEPAEESWEALKAEVDTLQSDLRTSLGSVSQNFNE